MSKPILIDAFCGAGGAGAGYRRGGFHVIGVDSKPQPRYAGDEFVQGDALIVVERLIVEREGIAAVHASPPCQASSDLRHRWPDREYPELIPSTRDLLRSTSLPYVIENVPGAALIEPFTLCGSMFGNAAGGRQLRRHRLFETNFPVMVPTCVHRGQPVGVYGTGGGGQMSRGYKGTPAEYREAMEMPWATKAEIAQAIPPSYTEHIGGFLAVHLQAVAA